MFQAIDFVSYPTQDLERAVAFYRDTLGLKVFSHTEGKWAELELPNGHTITLYPFAAMGDEASLAYRFARASLAHSTEADPLRDEIVARWGKAGLVSISLSMMAGRCYPTLKYALGYGKRVIE